MLMQNSKQNIVVDARVDSYLVENGNIYVARRPRILYRENGVIHSRLSRDCKFLKIIPSSGEVAETQPKVGISCNL